MTPETLLPDVDNGEDLQNASVKPVITIEGLPSISIFSKEDVERMWREEDFHHNPTAVIPLNGNSRICILPKHEVELWKNQYSKRKNDGLVPSVEREQQDRVIPWMHRTAEEWKRVASLEEVTRLFLLAKNRSQNSHDAWIQKWYLTVPYNLYFQHDSQLLQEHLVPIYEMEEKKHKRFKLDGTKMGVLQELFSDINFYAYLNQIRCAHRYGMERNTKGDNSYKFHEKFEKLVEIFSSVAKHIAYKRFGKREGDYKDWEAIALLALTERAVNFYWETMAIDLAWTVDRFYGSLRVSIHDPISNKFDTHTLEDSLETVEYVASNKSQDTEKQALDSIRFQEIWATVNTIVTTDEQRYFLALKMEGYSLNEISERMGLSIGFIRRTMVPMLNTLARELHIVDPDLPSQRRSESAENIVWQRLQDEKKFDEYKRRFEQRKHLVSPFRQQLMDAFFRLYTGNRKTTIDTVWQQEFSHCSRGTVRRQISNVLNVLDYKEPIPVPKYRSSATVKRAEKLYFQQAMNDPAIWGSFTQRQQDVVTLYLEDRIQSEIGRVIGIHESTVSRDLDRCLRKILRNYRREK